METLTVALIVAGAAAYVGRRVYRTAATVRRKSDGGCGGDCCSPPG